MSLIRWGIILLVIGVLLSLTGFLELAAAFQYIGWILLAVGIIVLVIHLLGGMTRT